MKISISKFADTQYRSFAVYDCTRKLPDVIDGLKITQRKILHACMELGLANKQIKVAQLASMTAGLTDYHHGEAGIGDVAAKMAQTFPGSNNVNMLEPIGQFGSRLNSDYAATRYIHTKLSENFREYFRREDDEILTYLYSDDQKIEPERFLPILPLLLINGSDGIAIGFACKIFNRNPDEVKKNVIAAINGKKLKPMAPWYRGFEGTIEAGEKENQWVFKGKFERINSTTIRITELPIGVYQNDIKKTLIKLQEQEVIKDYDDDSTANGINITVTIPRTTSFLDDEKLMEKFKLISKDTENLTAWGPDGYLRKFKSVEEIIECFVEYRLAKYEERRQKWISIVLNDLELMCEKRMFIDFYIKNSDKVAKKNKKELYTLLEEQGFKHIDALLDMKVYNMTKEQIEKLDGQIADAQAKLEDLEKSTNKDLYLKDLK